MVSVVLVENEFVVAEAIASRLRAAGFDIIGTPATGKDAIAQARKLHPDVVLMDVVLNGKMDGIEAAQQITERFDLPVIFLTAGANAETVKRVTATTSYGFLVKPFDDLELTAAIEMAIRRHSIVAKTRESDGSMRELTESLSEVIFETDMAGNITFINRAGLKEFGYTKEQVEGGMTLYDFLPSDKHEEIRESIAQAVIDEPSEWIKVPGLRRDGSTFPISVRASVIVREGVPVGIRGIALNFTEQNRAEQELEESERRIRELTDALPEIIFETDADGIVTFANATPFTRYGYTKGEIEGKIEFLDFVAPFDRERARETISKRIQGEDKGWAEYALIKKDGSTAPFDVRTTPIVRDGVYEGLRGIAIDITERKRAEAALISSERRIRELTDALPVVVYEADTTGRITFVNATALDLFGYTKEELEAGLSVFKLFAPADIERARSVYHQRLSGEDMGRVEYVALRKDGSTFPISIRAVPLRHNGIFGVRGIIVDITERRQTEQALTWEAAVDLAIAHLYIPLMASTSSIADVALATLDEAKKLTGSGAGFVAHIDPENRDMVAYGRTQMILTKPSILNTEGRVIPKERRQIRYYVGSDGSYPALWGYALNTKTGFYSNAPGIHPAARTAPSGDIQLAQFLAVPALIGEEVVGQIALANPGRDYTERDLKAIERLADVYALAIIRTRAEGRTKEDAYTIGGLNRIIAAGNRAESVQSFAETVTNLTLELMRLDAGALHLVDDDARYAKLRYVTGIPDTAADAIRTIPLDEAPYAALLAQGQSPQFFEDQEAPHAAVLGLASLVAVPLYSQDACVGALNVGSFKRHAFSRAEKELLAAIGKEVGTVIAKLQADEWVRAALKEKETLLKEIHHRVKNNMQVVSSLLSLQADRATNVEAQAVLTASQSQIRSIALIHEKLYGSGSLAEINFADYGGSLIKELLRMYHVAPEAVKITTNIEDVHFGVDTAMPCALILNELVSNSLKHAFPDGRKGEVTIGLQYADSSYTMTVADDGVGFLADVDFRATGSLGMQLVTALAGQLDGTIDMNRENGTSFVISFRPP